MPVSAAPALRVVTLEEFYADPQAVFEVARSGEPVALTVGGTVQAMLSTPTEADREELARQEQEDREFDEAMEEAEADVRAGRVIPFEQFAAEVRARHSL